MTATRIEPTREHATEQLTGLAETILNSTSALPEFPCDRASVERFVDEFGYVIPVGFIEKLQSRGQLAHPTDGVEQWHPEHAYVLLTQLVSLECYKRDTYRLGRSKSHVRQSREEWEVTGDSEFANQVEKYHTIELVRGLANCNNTAHENEVMTEGLLLRLQQLGVSRGELGIEA